MQIKAHSQFYYHAERRTLQLKRDRQTDRHRQREIGSKELDFNLLSTTRRATSEQEEREIERERESKLYFTRMVE